MSGKSGGRREISLDSLKSVSGGTSGSVGFVDQIVVGPGSEGVVVTAGSGDTGVIIFGGDGGPVTLGSGSGEPSTGSGGGGTAVDHVVIGPGSEGVVVTPGSGTNNVVSFGGPSIVHIGPGTNGT